MWPAGLLKKRRLLSFLFSLTAAICQLHAPPLADALPQASYSRRDSICRTGSPRQCPVRFVHHVRNLRATALQRVEVAVAVPRSDDRQTVHSVDFSPEPSQISSDGWGQETAHFTTALLPPGGEFEVAMTVHVSLRDVEWRVAERDVGTPEEIPERVLRHYLRNAENYKLDQEILQRAARELDVDGQSPLEKVRRVHDFVMDSLEYCRDDRWDPADTVLGGGKGSCSEYSYLMIALCRLSGIPARYAGGTWIEGATERLPHVDRVFHRWVEVYLPRLGWFPIDPTRDDMAEKEGEPYRYFGRLPWSYLTMARGDGDRFESGRLGWEYRSSTRWAGSEAGRDNEVVVERYAVWMRSGEGEKNAEVAQAD